MSLLGRSRESGRPSPRSWKAVVLAATVGFVVASFGACGGTTGRDGVPFTDAAATDATSREASADAGTDAPKADGAAPDATAPDGTAPDGTAPDGTAPDASLPVVDAAPDRTIVDFDEGLFDVVIPYADRVLPDVRVVEVIDSGADAPDGDGQAARAEDGSACVAFNTPMPVTLADGAVIKPDAALYSCTPTEQRFVDHSVDCYQCLINGSCLDDALYGDMGKECEDLSGTAAIGNRHGTSLTQLCWDTLDCILATKCAAPDDAGTADVARCYCGSLLGLACATSMAPGDGLCAQQEVDAIDSFLTDPASVVSPKLADVTTAAGKADAIFTCALRNGCADLCVN